LDTRASYLFLGLAVVYAIFWVRHGRWLAFVAFYGAFAFAVLEVQA